jgi:hypothetical protein
MQNELIDLPRAIEQELATIKSTDLRRRHDYPSS